MKKDSLTLLDNEETTIQLGSGSDDDSDAKQLFELPKRKVIRPTSMAFKKKFTKSTCWMGCSGCCGNCVAAILPIILAIFIVAMLLCITYLVMGLSGLRSEIHMLTIRLSNLEDSEDISVSRREKLVTSFKSKLKTINDHEKSFTDLGENVNFLHKKFITLNSTVYKVLVHPALQGDQLKNLVKDIDTLKTGMADTGADIEELKGNQQVLRRNFDEVKETLQSQQNVLYNITISLSDLGNHPFPTGTTTPQMLVVTMQPDDEQPVKQKEFKETLLTLKNQQKQCVSQTEKYQKNLLLFINSTHAFKTNITEEMKLLEKKMKLYSNIDKIQRSALTNSSANETGKNVNAVTVSKLKHVTPSPLQWFTHQNDMRNNSSVNNQVTTLSTTNIIKNNSMFDQKQNVLEGNNDKGKENKKTIKLSPLDEGNKANIPPLDQGDRGNIDKRDDKVTEHKDISESADHSQLSESANGNVMSDMSRKSQHELGELDKSTNDDDDDADDVDVDEDTTNASYMNDLSTSDLKELIRDMKHSRSSYKKHEDKMDSEDEGYRPFKVDLNDDSREYEQDEQWTK